MKGRRIRQTTLAVVVVLAVSLGALMYLGYRRDIHAARTRISSGSQVVNTPCGLIEYAEAGKGHPVLFVHGAGGGFDQGLDFARALLGDGFRVIAPSRFGYLGTPLPTDASPEAQADTHACLLDALNLPRLAVVGGSAGAPSSMQLCLRHPDRCSATVLLVPLAYAPRPEGEQRQPPSALAQFVMNTTLNSDFAFWLAAKVAQDTMMETILATPVADFRNASADEQERILQVLSHILPIRQRTQGLQNDAAIAASLPHYELERFTVPTLVISAENDLFGTFGNGRYTAEHIRGARFIGYPTGGHLLVGHRREVQSEVTRFLNKAEP